MYLFDKNGNEITINDLVYFMGRHFSDESLEEMIGVVSFANDHDGKIWVKEISTKTIFRENLNAVRKVPNTIRTLMMLEQ
jgi:hypothetical protein